MTYLFKIFIFSIFLLTASTAYPQSVKKTAKTPVKQELQQTQKDETQKATDDVKSNAKTPENNKPADTVVSENSIAPVINNDAQPAPANTEISTNRNLFQTVKSGGFLMIFIIFIGIVGLTIVIERLIFFTRQNVWKKNSLREFLEESASEANVKYREELEDHLRSTFQMYADNLEKGLTFLAGCANLAPIIGFLGTVTGMISAFVAIANATTVNAKVVAVGIQVALVTTAGGLFVAAPIFFAYYFFSHMIHTRYIMSERIINDLIAGKPRLSDKIK